MSEGAVVNRAKGRCRAGTGCDSQGRAAQMGGGLLPMHKTESGGDHCLGEMLARVGSHAKDRQRAQSGSGQGI